MWSLFAFIALFACFYSHVLNAKSCKALCNLIFQKVRYTQSLLVVLLYSVDKLE